MLRRSVLMSVVWGKVLKGSVGGGVAGVGRDGWSWGSDGMVRSMSRF
jgi:hypothetical protein